LKDFFLDWSPARFPRDFSIWVLDDLLAFIMRQRGSYIAFTDYQSHLTQKWKWKWQVANGVEREEPFYWRFEQTQVDVLDHFIPESPSFRLTNLLPNTSYVFAMMCHRFGGPDRPAALTITSDPIFFTTSKLNFILFLEIISSPFDGCQLGWKFNCFLLNVRWSRVHQQMHFYYSFSLLLGPFYRCNQHSSSLSAPKWTLLE